jgi:hypothetical protein
MQRIREGSEAVKETIDLAFGESHRRYFSYARRVPKRVGGPTNGLFVEGPTKILPPVEKYTEMAGQKVPAKLI